MLFFPFMADIKLPSTPVLTIFISLLCLLIYWQQAQSDADLIRYTDSFCDAQDSRKSDLILKKLAGASASINTPDVCRSVYLRIYLSSDRNKTIKELVEATPRFSTKSLKRTHEYINEYLTEKSGEFETGAPGHLSDMLRYDPKTYNVVKMVSSVFAHGSWSHVIGNLFFFFAFAATLEAILGIVFYPLIILALAIGTNLVYSLAVMATPDAVPTLGLSGVVMGAMGMFTYFIPNAKIKCFFWFIVFFRRYAIYAWILALWYFGWDLYDLSDTGTSGSVNLVAHVSGFIQGYLMGFLLFRWRKKEVHAANRESETRHAMSKMLT